MAGELDSETKLLQRSTEDVLYDTFREGSCAMKFVDRLLNELELEYVGVIMSVVQRLRTAIAEWCLSLSTIVARMFRNGMDGAERAL